MFQRPLLCVLAALCAALCFASSASAQIVAYEVPAGTAGTQDFGGSLGMDFDVNSDIQITSLGVFDDNSDGLGLPLRAHIYDRNDTGAPVVTLNFGTGATGTAIDGSRFLDLKSSPLVLPAGFQGTIVGEGYGGAERNGNVGTGSTAGTTNDGGGQISFVGGGRFGGNNTFPGTPDGGPANRYHAGTFQFDAATVAPNILTGAIPYVVPEGTVGNQAFGGALGMDFNVLGEPIVVDQLGVFDSGSDGLNLTITAHIYDRTDTASPLASLDFTPGDPGTLVDGSRFKDLIDELVLPAGFQGTIVAEGYGAGEPNGNSGGAVPVWSNDTYNLLDLVGSGRFGVTPGLFPGTPDGGPANRYAAGTFRFSTQAALVPEPGSVAIWSVLGFLAAGMFFFRSRITT